MDDAEQFLPLYLRFIKGVLDSSDLPLNVSRELLQKDPEVEAMRGALTQPRAGHARRSSRRTSRRSTRRSGRNSAQVLKEGVAEDFANRDKLLPLLRFASTHEAGDEDQRGAGRLRRAHAGRPGEDLLRAGGQPRRGARQPVHRAAARARASRCCCWATASTNGSWARCTSSKASASRTPRAATWTSAKRGRRAERRQGRGREGRRRAAARSAWPTALGDAVAEVRASRA